MRDNDELRRRRIYSKKSEEDNRNHFQKDRDRVLYAPEFHRLAGIAQVVHANTERGYHNRLTHSLKVAQVGRRLAEHLGEVTNDETVREAGGLDPDVVETACLAHDLGHPPFGHPAEGALQEKLEEDHSVDDSFEGNPQSFRIVNNVAIHKESYGDDHRGLDLTLASLNAIVKYPWTRGPTRKKKRKWGCYSTELDEFRELEELRTPGSDGDELSLEARIMDWADDLTYAVHDVIDFYEAGLIPLDELIEDSRERGDLVDAFEDEHDGDEDVRRWDATGFLDGSLPRLAEVAEGGYHDETRKGPLEAPFRERSRQRAGVSFLSSNLIERYLGLPSDVQVDVDPGVRGGLDIHSHLKCEIKLLQFLTEHYVFSDPALLAQQRGHKELVRELFEALFRATEKQSDYRGMVPPPFDEKIERIHEGTIGYDDIEDETLRARVVADTIASMTEQQAMELHERMTGQSPGLVTDRIV